MRSLNLAILIICSVNSLFGQTVNQGARFTAIGNTGVALQDIWSLQSNQAGLAGIKKAEAAMACQMSFLNSGISTQTILFAYPFHGNVFGFSAQSYGIDEFKQQRFGFAYARGFGETIFASLDFNIHRVAIVRYGSAASWSAEAGLQYKASENLSIGVHVANPGRNSFSDEVNSSIPEVFELGIAAGLSDKMTLNSAIVKEPGSVVSVRGGMEYNMLDKLFLRGGICTNPFSQYYGAGYRFHSFNADVAFAYYPALGYSPQLSVGYEF